jgi:hypothetical protein
MFESFSAVQKNPIAQKAKYRRKQLELKSAFRYQVLLAFLVVAAYFGLVFANFQQK